MNIQRGIQMPWSIRSNFSLTGWNPSLSGPYLVKCHSVLSHTNITTESAPWISNDSHWVVPHLLRATTLDFTGPLTFPIKSHRISYGICPGFYSWLKKKQFNKRAVVRKNKAVFSLHPIKFSCFNEICCINNNASNIRTMVSKKQAQRLEVEISSQCLKNHKIAGMAEVWW